jgi:uroporphyrinogen decarboxylase
MSSQQTSPPARRKPNCLAKLDRMSKTLRHEEGDRVPVSDFFWGSFLKRWREELGLAADADIYRHYDLDWQVTLPNMDPHIRAFEIVRQTEEEVVVRTGFGAVIRKRYDQAMPAFVGFETNTLEKLELLKFDDPWDDRRYFREGDNQIAGVGDGFERNSPAWIETVKRIRPDFPVYGSVCEAHEMLWRIVGSENVMLWIGEAPERLGPCIEKVGLYCVELARAQIRAAGGMLDGMVVWGDVAYKKGMLFSPVYWRRWFKPWVKQIVSVCHDAGLPVIYHGCGNARRIFEDLIEIGVDAYNPLEAKAGLDVVELRQSLGRRLAFCGNMDVWQWATGSEDELRETVLRKLSAARGGGYIFQSDHSVPGNISAARYEFVVNLVREYGRYPIGSAPVKP